MSQIDAMAEVALLKALANKDNFDLYEHSINKKRVLPQTLLMLDDYKKYFEMYPEHGQINFGLFYTQFSQAWHEDTDEQEMEYYKNYLFPALDKINVEEIESCLLGLMKRQTSDSIRDVLKRDLDVSKIKELLDAFEIKQSDVLKTVDLEVHTIDKVDFSVLDKSKGVPWFLPSMQEGLGGLVKGQLVVVAADFGTGKSAFVISQAAAAIEHFKKNKIDKPVLYFNSEGTEADIFGRLCSNLFRDKVPGGFEDIVINHEKVKNNFIKQYGTNSIYVVQMTNSTIEWIKAKIQKYDPGLVIIDITDTLAPEENAQTLKKVYDNLRLLSGAFCPIIATTQSGNTSYTDGESGEQKTRKWLKDKDLYGSKTGKGGAADTIVAIGRDDANPKLRYISTPKKKRGTPVNVSCTIEEKFSLYEELAW